LRYSTYHLERGKAISDGDERFQNRKLFLSGSALSTKDTVPSASTGLGSYVTHAWNVLLCLQATSSFIVGF
jgi:hypothetical protein